MRRAALAVTLALWAAACGGSGPSEAQPPDSPEAAVAEVFEVARRQGTALAALEPLFRGPEDSPLHLRRALEELAEAEDWRLVGRSDLGELGRAVLDVELRLRGGSRARVSFQLERVADGSWRVVAILGPGIEWPAFRPWDATGLSVSPPAPER